jgi:hypothetical protein
MSRFEKGNSQNMEEMYSDVGPLLVKYARM